MWHFFLSFIFFLGTAFSAYAEVNIQETRSPKGVNAWMMSTQDLPFIVLHINFKGGSVLDRAGKEGEVSLMSSLLEEGSGPYDAQNFALERQKIAADFSFYTTKESLSVTARFLKGTTNEAIALLRHALFAPHFSEDDFERVREQISFILSYQEEDPEYLSQRTFQALAFGEHPYAHPEMGTPQTLASLTVEDMRTTYQRVISQDNLQVSVVGDISEKELGDVLDTLFADLPNHKISYPSNADFVAKGGIYEWSYDTPQSSITFGQAGISNKDPDFFAAYIIAEAMAGGFKSRLMKTLREDRGLIYGVSVGLDTSPYGDTIVGNLATENPKVPQVIRLIQEEWSKMAISGMDTAELQTLKNYITGAYPLRFDSNESIAGIMANMQLTGRPIEYITTRNAQVNAVTVEDIQRVAKRIMDQNHLVFVVAGDAQDVENVSKINKP